MKIKEIITTKNALTVLSKTVVKSGVWDIKSALKVKKLMRQLQGHYEDYEQTIKGLAEDTEYAKYESEKADYINKFGIKDSQGRAYINPSDTATFEAFLKFHDELSSNHKEGIESFTKSATELLDTDIDIEIKNESKFCLSEIENISDLTAEFLNHLHFVLREE